MGYYYENPDIPWSWYSISQNPNITWDIIRDNPDKDWNWLVISQHKNITIEIILDNPDIPGMGFYILQSKYNLENYK